MNLSFVLPVKTVSEANSRLEWVYLQTKGKRGEYGTEVEIDG